MNSIIISLSIPLIPYSYSVEVSIFSLDLYTIGGTPWTSDRPVARSLPKYRNPRSQRPSEDSSCLRPLGYCDRLAFEWTKTVHALDRSATVIG
jgi:hypothetical protein